ncbi:MAG: SAM-dependent methyltransferase [Nanoarchaeota archaeon]|nr:SAM-dependent methyltransferase [Nanoarchaeota archaeon]
MAKKEETNDVIQYLIPNLEKADVPKENCKFDTTTDKSGRLRGDGWISRKKQKDTDFWENIIGLVEAKHRKCVLGDMDWRDAMMQGKKKAEKQGLNYYIVTNCIDMFRFYNRFTDDNIYLDGRLLTRPQSLEVLEKIQTQVNKDNSSVTHKTTIVMTTVPESKFKKSLKKIEHVYRSCAIVDDACIDPTVSFVIFKYIGEEEKIKRTLPTRFKIWDEYGKNKEDFIGDFKLAQSIFDEVKEYADFKTLVGFSEKLENEHYKQIYEELDSYHFHGCNFDIFGSVYEEYASDTMKRDFGKFYTRRHITGMVARLLLRNEINPYTELKICDPACGTGGFLTEAYKVLRQNYKDHNKLNDKVEEKLTRNTFWGFDNDDKSVARTKLNMFLVGDGHVHIYLNDSLVGWNPNKQWEENQFNYILTNPPIGDYKGKADIKNFDFTNNKRYELLFLEKVIKATKYGGEIAIVTSDGTLEAPTHENFRKKVLERCNINAIVSLTKFAFAPYTKEKTYILFMQKKQKDDIGSFQETPIWHYIVDYDGFANSDKRYKTKWHNDLVELEDLFVGAVTLGKRYKTNREDFDKNRSKFERKVNHKEKEEELEGMKCKFVEMKEVNEENFHYLLSEFHLRNYEIKTISLEEFDKKLMGYKKRLREVVLGDF